MARAAKNVRFGLKKKEKRLKKEQKNNLEYVKGEKAERA